MWPSTAAIPATAGPVAPGSICRATSTLAIPFPTSSAIALTPIFLVVVRNRLAAPTLPLPAMRRSIPRWRRASRYANGIDPRRYPTRRARYVFAVTIVKALPQAGRTLVPPARGGFRTRLHDRSAMARQKLGYRQFGRFLRAAGDLGNAQA